MKVADLTGHQARVLSLAQSPDGTTVLSASADETLRFWKIFSKADKKARQCSSRARRERRGGIRYGNDFDRPRNLGCALEIA